MNEEQRKVLIVAGNMKEAYKCAEENHLEKFHWNEDLTTISAFGKHDGFNSDNTIIWLAGNYLMHRNYLYLQHISHKFNIPIVDMTETPFNPFLIETEYTVH